MESLVQLGLIWCGVLAAVGAARLTRMTPVVYYLGAGCLFVNLGWLPEQVGALIASLSELGIILILFALGFEENTSGFLASLRRSWGIAFFGALGPFLATFGVTYAFWGDPQVSTLCGLAMTATAVSLTMVSLREEGLQASPVATRIMTSAVIDDIASLALVAVVVPIATGSGEATPAGVAATIGRAVLFFLLITATSKWVFPTHRKGWLARIPWLEGQGMRSLLGVAEGRFATLQVLLLAILGGVAGHAFGLHAAVGAYMTGLILHEEQFDEGEGVGSYAATRRVVDKLAFTWIGPVFFVVLGTELVYDHRIFVSVIPEVIALYLALALAQVSSAGLAARTTGGLDAPSSLMVGFGMLGRAELAFVVMDIAYVQHRLLTAEAFYTLMCTCFLLNVSVPIAIRLWKPRLAA